MMTMSPLEWDGVDNELFGCRPPPPLGCASVGPFAGELVYDVACGGVGEW